MVTVEEMREADAAALARLDQDTLVRRAGWAVAHKASAVLGGAAGRRVRVLAGKGNNGADGKVAAALLRRRGAKVEVVEAGGRGALGPADLVIDAAVGTGFRGSFEPPPLPEGVPVLAVDIPSGIDGDTGEARGRPWAARFTVTMAAWKRGLLLGDGPALAGEVTVADIGIEAEAQVALVEDADVDTHVARRAPGSHKWDGAVAVVAGSPGMEGAANLSARGAMRVGAGMVRLGVPGTAGGRPGPWPLEAVRLGLAGEGWAEEVAGALGRCRALVVGPGLGRDEATSTEVRRLLAQSPVPAVVDADALFALGRLEGPVATGAPAILTPHDGEYARLMGQPPGPDRIGAARALAERSGAVALLKGPLTVVAAPRGTGQRGASTLVCRAGSPRLATAGTGDVLSGMIGAMVARGLDPLAAAAIAAHVHGRAAGLGMHEGLVAGDLPDLVARWLSGRHLQGA